MSTKILILCTHCSKEFYILKKEHTRQTTKGRNNFFCSRSCSGKRNITKNITKRYVPKGNKLAYKSKFTKILNKSRNRGRDFNLDQNYLEEIWSGKCSITNIDIHLDKKLSLSSASLDRIDSNKGYIKGNVQFVAYGVNLAKNKFSDNEIKKFIKEISLSLSY